MCCVCSKHSDCSYFMVLALNRTKTSVTSKKPQHSRQWWGFFLLNSIQEILYKVQNNSETSLKQQLELSIRIHKVSFNNETLICNNWLTWVDPILSITTVGQILSSKMKTFSCKRDILLDFRPAQKKPQQFLRGEGWNLQENPEGLFLMLQAASLQILSALRSKADTSSCETKFLVNMDKY